jgi:hypothetical protein
LETIIFHKCLESSSSEETKVADNSAAWPAIDLFETHFTKGWLYSKHQRNAVKPRSKVWRGD